MRVHELPGVGHFLPEEAPEAVVDEALPSSRSAPPTVTYACPTGDGQRRG